ncbi:DUF2061 domain-containing protein [Paucihalobacter ruber]|uniref:DUF2061 domain-containing protein n=1 Tax=Paucihalobacter ruber TaxID=2567861 RepID=A0A506PKX3_9FLAO|nr:DUF2061 domain-containing protein [Paucihalobacter ruber]TPV33832.1 DUF2061 domain-containing protein [Paucihalobacter ruber]
MISSSHKRHLLKALSWRILGTLDTMLLAWLISGNPLTGFKIGLAEVVTKIGLYYLHERVWFKVDLKQNHQFANSQYRHIAKTITWRVVGTLDTMLLAWLISGDPMIGLKVGLAEVLTKMLLYYLHERMWYRINFGLDRKTIEDE